MDMCWGIGRSLVTPPGSLVLSNLTPCAFPLAFLSVCHYMPSLVSPARGSPNPQEGLETLNVKHNIDFSLWKILKVLMPLYMMYFIIWKFLKVANTFIKGLREQIIKGKRQAGLLWNPLFFMWNQEEKEKGRAKGESACNPDVNWRTHTQNG